MLGFLKTFGFKIRNLSDFWKSSFIVFTANLATGVLNYILVILVSRFLKEEYSLWTALSSLVAIITTLGAGFSLEIHKKISYSAHNSKSKPFLLKSLFRKEIQKWVLIGLVLSPFFALSINLLAGYQSFGILILIFWQTVFGFYLIIGVNFLVATLRTWQFGLTVFLGSLAKLVTTLILLYSGFGLWSLAIGLLAGSLFTYFLSEVLVWGEFNKKISDLKGLENKSEYSIKALVEDSLKSTIILFLISALFNILPIISEANLTGSEKDLMAVLFNFGQIIHFGTVAFTASLITFGARNSSMRILKNSLFIGSFLSLTISLIFYFAGDFMLKLFNRSEYIDKINYILFFAGLVFLYNLIFLICQYFLSQNKFKQLYPLGIFLILQIILSYQLNFFTSISGFNSVIVFILINLLVWVLLLVWLFQVVYRNYLNLTKF